MNPSSRPSALHRVVIVGGGFTGASAAVQLVRRSRLPLAITIIDPAERAGRGLAYHASDPDHRLNAPSYVHSLLPDDAWHFSRWCHASGQLERDPQALRPDGALYIRRTEFGRYIEETLQAHALWPATGSTITHLRDRAIELSPSGLALHVTTAGGHTLPAELLFIATGNPLPRLQRPFAPALAAHRAVIENPLDTPRLWQIAPQARVLLVGSGLTALDVLSTLVRRQHRGEILVVSRRGLR
ncbi:MAG TPA: FAD-dependent oxidoreductase, partial [Burkholderiaceae bacterium]